MPLPDSLIKKLDQAHRIWALRNARIRDLWNLIIDHNGKPGTDSLEAPGQESVCGNDPITDLSLSIHLLSTIPPRHRLLTSPDDNVVKELAGKAERALVSMWRSLDDDRLDSGLDSWVRELAFWMGLTGCYDVAPRVEVVDGQPTFIADIHNPEFGYPIYGDRHLMFYTYTYPATIGHVLDKAEVYESSLPHSLQGRDPTEPARIADAWEFDAGKVYNTIAVMAPEPHLLRPRLHMEQFSRIPVLVGTVGGIPRFPSRVANAAVSGSILWQNERIYATLNRWRTHQMQLARDASQAPLIVAGSGLEVTKDNTRKSDIRLQGDILFTPNTQASVRRVDPGAMPVDIRIVDSQLEGMRQRGSYPALLFGGLNVDLSGFAIQQLLNAAFHRLGPHKAAIERIVSRVDRIWLEGFREANKPITISGRDRHSYFREEFTATDVPESFDCMVDLRLSLPSDLLSRLSAARSAKQQGPILDMDTILDEILQVDDPTLVKRRIDEDNTEGHPIIVQLKFIKELFEYSQELRQKGQGQLAAIVEALVKSMMTQATQAAGAQSKPSQPAPGAMPPEAAGMSPDMANAMLGGSRGAGGPANVPAELQGGV